MMKMKTQFGMMIITDDNKTVTNEQLKKEINDKMINGKEAQISIIDENVFKELDK